MHVAATPLLIELPPETPSRIVVTITNTTSVIDAYSVRTYGLDPRWVTVTPERLSLFPSEVGLIEITITLPTDFPAGLRQLAVHVQSENDPAEFSLAQIALDVGARTRTTLRVDPVSVTGGNKADFSLILANEGNSTVQQRLNGVDPEDILTFRFDQPSVVLPPQRREIVQTQVKGGRPWLGNPKPRVLEFTAGDAPPVMATFVQKPRIGRLLISLLGLLTVAAIFAAVLSHAVDQVVDEADVDDALLNQALANEDDQGESVPVEKSTVTGVLVLPTGAGASGVQADLFSSENGEEPVASAATDPEGTFTFGRLNEGTYRVRFSGAGFEPKWYPDATTFAEAEDLEVSPTKSLTLKNVPLGGRPGIISGEVISDDPVGATVRLVVAGIADPETPALVSEEPVSADGSFLFEEVPSPGQYQLILEKAGFETEQRDVVLQAAQELDGIVMSLREGDGEIAGSLQSETGPLGGVTVTATDGTATFSTVSLTQDNIGHFSLRDLTTPGRYTLMFEAAGYNPQTRSVDLGAGQRQPDLSITLVPSTGSITGTVSELGGGPVGGVTVTVSGGDTELMTLTASQGTPGAYRFTGLPAPAAYTVTFSKDGLISQSRMESLDPANGRRDLSAIDATLAPQTAMVRGTVRGVSGAPIGGATVTLTDGTEERTLLTADEPAGAFEFSGVLPGAYTVSATLPGSAPEIVLVDVLPAEVEQVDIGLRAQASLAGQVLVLNKEIKQYVPLRGAEVRLYDPTDFPGSARAARATATTDSDGRYEFLDLPAPNDFVVAVYADDSSSDALDSVLVQTIPSTPSTVPTFRLQTAA